MSLSQIKPLAATNFIEWRAEILPRLQLKDVDELLSRDPLPINPDDGPEVKATAILDHSKDKAARALLQIHMTTDIVIQVSHLTTAKSMWDYLLQHFNRDCASNELSLLRQLFKCEKSPAEDLSGFFARVQKLSLQLHLIGNKPSDTILAGVIMNGLPEEYSSLVQTISNTIPVDHHGRQILDVAAIQSKLLIEEQRVLEQRESSSFAVKREATKKQVCSYCGKFYHSFD